LINKPERPSLCLIKHAHRFGGRLTFNYLTEYIDFVAGQYAQAKQRQQ